MAIFHITPENDLKKHYSDGTPCPCSPKVKVMEETGDLMYVHNSWDGREVWEQLMRKAKDEYSPN